MGRRVRGGREEGEGSPARRVGLTCDKVVLRAGVHSVVKAGSSGDKTRSGGDDGAKM